MRYDGYVYNAEKVTFKRTHLSSFPKNMAIQVNYHYTKRCSRSRAMTGIISVCAHYMPVGCIKANYWVTL